MKKYIIITALAAAALSGCGGGATDTDTPVSRADDVAEPTDEQIDSGLTEDNAMATEDDEAVAAEATDEASDPMDAAEAEASEGSEDDETIKP